MNTIYIPVPVDKELPKEIANCPFCNGEPEIILRGNAFTKKRNAEIRCGNCNVEMVVAAVHGTLEWCKEKVIKKWNKRETLKPITSLSELPEEWKAEIREIAEKAFEAGRDKQWADINGSNGDILNKQEHIKTILP